MFCSQCGKPNDDSANFCIHCGTTLKPAINLYTPPSPAIEEPLPDTNALYLASIGHPNSDYYLERFHRFDRQEKIGPGWNWSVFFVSFYWFLYRKMWGAAAWYFFLFPILATVVGIVAYTTEKSTALIVLAILCTLYLIGVFVLLPMYANALYYRHCRKKIAAAQQLTSDLRKQHSQLKTYGGSNIVVPLVVLGVLFFGAIPVLGIVSAIAIPAYSDYTIRANTDEAISFAKGATTSIDTYYYKHGKTPDTLKEAGFAEKLPSSVSKIDYDIEEPSIIVTMAKKPLKGQTLQWDASLDDNEHIVWRCHSEQIPSTQLPKYCR